MLWLKRFLPQRLAGQMIAVLLLALVLAQVITIMIFADERRFAIQAADRAQILGRTASIVRLLENSPPSLHQQIVETASGRRLRYWLSDESVVGAGDEHDLSERAQARFRNLLGEEVDRDMRITFGDDHGPWAGWWRGRVGGEDEDDHQRGGAWREGDHDHHGPFSILMSTRLGNGDWLNFATRLPPPTFGWKLPALTWLAIMAIAVTLVVIVMVRRITRPIASLAAAAEKAGRGETIPPLMEVGPLDIRQATSAFNSMHDRIKRFVQDRTRMLAAMSHDLRTPITTLRLRAEFIEDDETRNKILETLEDMQRMTEATLAFMREEAKVEPTRRVDLGALIESVVADFSDLGHDVGFAQSARIAFDCRPAGLKRALRNLLENAVRYGDQAEVCLVDRYGRLEVTIDDCGPGIPDDDIERMFQPFVRLDESRSQEFGGIGLGLAIARSIIRGHGGDVTLANKQEGGLRATISLPLGKGRQDDRDPT
ncbi:MAG: ATP-binding protein [Geminicoccaceae bacterium]